MFSEYKILLQRPQKRKSEGEGEREKKGKREE
jgi:hypothetical protein